jgi:hypothetical protein
MAWPGTAWHGKERLLARWSVIHPKSGGMLSGDTKGSLRRGKNIGENTDGPAAVYQIYLRRCMSMKLGFWDFFKQLFKISDKQIKRMRFDPGNIAGRYVHRSSQAKRRKLERRRTSHVTN